MKTKKKIKKTKNKDIVEQYLEYLIIAMNKQIEKYSKKIKEEYAKNHKTQNKEGEQK